MMTYLVRYTQKGEDQRVDLKSEHLAYLTELYKAGLLLAAGKFPDKVGGYLLFRTNSLAETQGLVEQDPYIINGARNFDIEGWDTSPFPLRLAQLVD